jgi:hypothetical protein
MAFSFGNVRQNAPKKDAKRTRYDYILHENYEDPDEPCYLILTDCIIDSGLLELLKKDVGKRLTNYVIASAVTTKSPKIADENALALVAEGKADTAFMLNNESEWRLLLKQQNIEAVLTLGSALFCAQKSADTFPSHYFDDVMHKPRCFLSEEFAQCGDLFYYPAPGIYEIYPLEECGADYVNFKTRFFWAQLERIKKDNKDPSKDFDMRPYKIHVIENTEQFKEVIKSMTDSEVFAADTETTGLDPWTCKLGCFTFTNDGVNGYYVDWKYVDKRLLSSVWKSCKKVVFVNAKFDVKFLWQNGLSKTCTVTDDAMLLAHAIDSGRFKGLKPNAIFSSRFGNYEHNLDKAKKELNIDSYMDIPLNILVPYATLDAIVTWRIFSALLNECRTIDKKFPNEKNPGWTIERWYSEIMMPTYLDMIEHEYEGMYIDEETLFQARIDTDTKIEEAAKALNKAWNSNLSMDDFKSSKILGDYIEHTLKWPAIERGKEGALSTGDKSLTEWKIEGRPGIDELQEFRSLQMGRNMFAGWKDEKGKPSGWEMWIKRHSDGTLRIHTNYNAFGTETFRHKGKDPNLQQIPSRGLLSKIIKPIISCPCKIKYKIKDENKIYEGYGNDCLIIKRGNSYYKACFSMIQKDDQIIKKINEVCSPDIVVENGSIRPELVKTFLEKYTNFQEIPY